MATAPPGCDWELVVPPLLGQPAWLTSAREKDIRILRLYGRTSASGGNNFGYDVLGAHVLQLAKFFQEGHLHIQAAVIMATPPNEAGTVGLGTNLDSTYCACQNAPLIVAQINRQLPDFSSGARIPLGKLTRVVELDEHPSTLPPLQPAAVHLEVTRHLVPLLPETCTLRLPFGLLGAALGRHLTNHPALTLYTDVLSEAAWPLWVAGQSMFQRDRGVQATSVAGGQEFYRVMAACPGVRLEPVEVLCHPSRLGCLQQFVAAVCPVAIDLSGNALLKNDPAGPVFVEAAGCLPGGLALAMMTHSGGPRTGIVDQLPWENASVVRPETVATEYGATQLSGRSESERAAALIELAPPERRPQLWEYAVRELGLPRNWPVQNARKPENEPTSARIVRTRTGQPLLLRPLRPSDARQLREFFYSHTEETIRSRYGFLLRRMRLERALELTGVDQERDVALALFSLQGGNQTIEAVGRYYLDELGRSGELAFVTRESRRRQGLSTLLLEELIAVAEKKGLQSLWAQVDRSNLPMLRLFLKVGFTSRATEDMHTLRVDLPLPHKFAKFTPGKELFPASAIHPSS